MQRLGDLRSLFLFFLLVQNCVFFKGLRTLAVCFSDALQAQMRRCFDLDPTYALVTFKDDMEIMLNNACTFNRPGKQRSAKCARASRIASSSWFLSWWTRFF